MNFPKLCGPVHTHRDNAGVFVSLSRDNMAISRPQGIFGDGARQDRSSGEVVALQGITGGARHSSVRQIRASRVQSS
jgi:hypothetical protein